MNYLGNLHRLHLIGRRLCLTLPHGSRGSGFCKPCFPGSLITSCPICRPAPLTPEDPFARLDELGIAHHTYRIERSVRHRSNAITLLSSRGNVYDLEASRAVLALRGRRGIGGSEISLRPRSSFRCRHRVSESGTGRGPGMGEAYRFEIGGRHWIFGGDPVVLRFLGGVAPIEGLCAPLFGVWASHGDDRITPARAYLP